MSRICAIILGGACAPPFCAVGRLSAPFNASSASWKALSIRRRKVFKGFGRRELESYQAHRKTRVSYNSVIAHPRGLLTGWVVDEFLFQLVVDCVGDGFQPFVGGSGLGVFVVGEVLEP